MNTLSFALLITFGVQLYDAKQYVQNQDILNTANMRFIDWTRGESVRHPWVFRADDLDLLMRVPHFWARKFDERVDAEIIDLIYGQLLKKQA